MKVRLRFLSLAIMGLLAGATSVPAVTIQSENDVLEDGTAFLILEAESVAELGGDETTGWLVVDSTNPIKSIETAVKGNLDILPADTNASGGAALLDQLGGGRHANTAKWEVQFAIPATYYLYVHASIYNSDGNTSYGNEDSFYLPPAFDLSPSDGWLGFEGEDLNGDPKVGDSIQDGWMPVFNNKVVMSAGDTEVHNDTGEDFWDGNFHWFHADAAVDSDENGSYLGDYGIAIKYEVTEEDINKVLTFEISTREHYGVIDQFVFTTSNEMLLEYTQEQMAEFFLNRVGPGVPGDFDGDGQLTTADIDLLTAESAAGTNGAAYDLDGNGAVDQADIRMWAKDLRNTWIGDANVDGVFDSTDLVALFSSGKYEIAEPAVWSQGDFNGDGLFNSSDLVEALQDGGYEQGPVAAVSAVPEPSSVLLGLLGTLALAMFRRR